MKDSVCTGPMPQREFLRVGTLSLEGSLDLVAIIGRAH